MRKRLKDKYGKQQDEFLSFKSHQATKLKFYITRMKREGACLLYSKLKKRKNYMLTENRTKI